MKPHRTGDTLRPCAAVLLLILASIPVKGTCAGLQITRQSEGFIQLRVSFDRPSVETLPDLDGRSRSRVRLKGAAAGGDGLPFVCHTLHLPAGQVEARLVGSSTVRLPAPPPLELNEIPLSGGDPAASAAISFPGYSGPPVSLRRLGRCSGIELGALELHPLRYDSAAGELVLLEEMTIEISGRPAQSEHTVALSQDDRARIEGLGALSLTGTRTAPKPRLGKTVPYLAGGWKILINDDGLYRISGEDLSAAGISLLSVDVATLRLTLDGQDVPVHGAGLDDGQFDREDYIEFWGQSRRGTYLSLSPDMVQDPYESTNAYWLTWGGSRGRWLEKEDGSIPASEASRYTRLLAFRHTEHVEQDNHYDRLSDLPLDTPRDFRFFDRGLAAGRKQDYVFQLWDPEPNASFGVSVRVMMSGRTTSDTLAHSVSAFLNDSYIGTGQWWRQDYHELTSGAGSAISGADLRQGDNRITLVNNVDARTYDFIMLNWFEVSYPRKFRARNGMLRFSLPPGHKSGHYLFEIEGFEQNDIDLFKLGHSVMVGGEISRDQDGTYRIRFQDALESSEIEYVAVSPAGRRKPFGIVADRPTRLHSSDMGADMVILAHQRFASSPKLAELAAARRANGLRVLLVDVQDVYDEFNGGAADPNAIRSFLKWAAANWQPPALKYLLLIGDGCYERYSADGDTLDLIPVYMRQTYSFGAAASDHWYALLDGDDEIPDLHVGRLPVRRPEELEIAIDKILRYESGAESGEWRNRLLFIGGNGEIFRIQGSLLATQSPQRMDTRKLFTVRDKSLPNDPFYGSTAQLLDHLAGGCAVVSFHGHGGGAIWADNGLLSLEDTEGINNAERLPVILSMTCFTGAFESPANNSLADALLYSSENGAVAILAASGVGWLWNDHFFQYEILNTLFQHPELTLGEVIDAGKIAYLAKYGNYVAVSQLNQYHLLGDPAMPVRLPDQVVPVEGNTPIPNPGERLELACETPFASGDGYFALVDSLRLVLSEAGVPISGGRASASVEIPAQYGHDEGHVRFTGIGEMGLEMVHGAFAFSLTGVRFDSAAVIRDSEDSLYFHTRITSREPLTELLCISGLDTIAMVHERGDWHRTQRALKRVWYGSDLYYFFTARTADGRRHQSQTLTYYLPKGMDLGLLPEDLRFGGEIRTALEAGVSNYGDAPGGPAAVQFLVRDIEGVWQPVGMDSITVMPGESVVASVPFDAVPGPLHARLQIDPDLVLAERNRGNNFIEAELYASRYNCSPEHGITIGGQVLDTLEVDSSLSLVLPAGAVPYPCVLGVEARSLEIHEQPDLVPIPAARVHEFSWSRDLQRLGAPLQIRMTLDQPQAQAALFRFENALGKWVQLSTQRSGRHLFASLDRPGRVTALAAGDALPPSIELTIDGGPHTPGTYAGCNSQLAVRLQDANGVLALPPHLDVLLDGAELEAADLSLPDSLSNANHVTLLLPTGMDPGDHDLEVRAMDCSGNTAGPLVFPFQVSDRFELVALGNYPNPFDRETIFAFLLTQPVEQLRLRIYTASGRCIRELDARDASGDPNPLSADYHELFWDGSDQEGAEVANGVYFYKISASQSDRTHEVKGKVAKIR